MIMRFVPAGLLGSSLFIVSLWYVATLAAVTHKTITNTVGPFADGALAFIPVSVALSLVLSLLRKETFGRQKIITLSALWLVLWLVLSLWWLSTQTGLR